MILSKTVFIKKPTGSYCKYYKNLGYDISKDIIEIDINHLSLGSKTKVDVICDYCSINKKVSYSDYNKSTKNGNLRYSCKSCGKIKQKELFLEKWGVENPFQVPEFQIKIKEKLIVKYGVDNFTKTDEYKEKYKSTCLERYGIDNYSKTDEYKEKYKSTSLERYGVDNFTKTDEYKEKSKSTSLERYGVDNFTKTDEYKEKYKSTCLERYGVEYHTKDINWKNKIKDINLKNYGNRILSLSDKFRKENFNISNDENYIQYLGDRISLFKCIKGHNFEIHYDNYKSRIYQKLDLCTICYPINENKSIKEKELFEFIKSIYTGEIIQSYRDGLEVDIYLPELKIGFEFNGLYWHSEIYKDKHYHLDKTNSFKERGIRIIHIWEDDWTFKKDIIKSQIINAIGKSIKIFARKCFVKEVNDINIIKDFLNKNHIQGWINSKVKIGLYFNDELVSLMTFDQFEGRKKMKDGEWNLSRFCNKLNYSVVGGASKLLKYFIESNNPCRIISYADKDWSIGSLYHNIGFIKINENLPDYKYIIENKRIHKSGFKKSIIGISESKLNLIKIWDCGKIKFEKLIKNYKI